MLCVIDTSIPRGTADPMCMHSARSGMLRSPSGQCKWDCASGTAQVGLDCASGTALAVRAAGRCARQEVPVCARLGAGAWRRGIPATSARDSLQIASQTAHICTGLAANSIANGPHLPGTSSRSIATTMPRSTNAHRRRLAAMLRAMPGLFLPPLDVRVGCACTYGPVPCYM